MSQFVTKWANDFVATGKNMQRWQMQHKGNFPFCQEEKEDVNHILHYSHKDAKRASKEALWQQIERLAKIGTCTRAVIAIKY